MQSDYNNAWHGIIYDCQCYNTVNTRTIMFVHLINMCVINMCSTF